MKKDELLPKGRWVSIALWDKIWKIMRLTGLFLMISFVAISAGTYSQNTRFSFKMENSTLNNLFLYLEQNSGYRFAYNKSDLDDAQKISCEFTNESIDQILGKVLDTNRLSISIKNEYIIITGRGNTIENSVQVSQSVKNISGKVTDSSGVPLPGVSVVVKGTTNGIITSADGNYTLSRIPENATLQFSFVGMKTQEIYIGTKTTIDVTLIEDAIGIDEVVAIGYGTKTKATVTGSVSVVNDKELKSRPAARTTDLLQGLASGVQVTRNNSGRLGDYTNNSISIRGISSANNPGVLVVIDGIAQKDNNAYALDNINPDDIESVSILKDAQAAIYGARAAGGVILITTKKGVNMKPTIDFSYNYNLQVPDNLAKGTNILQIVEMQDEAYKNDGQETNMYSHIVKYIADNKLTIDMIKKNDAKYYVRWPFDNSANFVFGHYDWNDIMWDPAPIQTYNIAISGKTDKMNYYNSIGYVDQKSMLAFGDNSNKRLFVKLKNDFEITSYLKIKSIFDFEKQNIVEPSRYAGGRWNTLENQQGMVWPVFMPYNSKGHYYNFGSHENPIGYAVSSGSTRDINYRVKGLVGAVLTPLKDLKITAEVSNSFDIRENEWSLLGFDMYNENDVFSYNSLNNRNSAGTNYGRSRYMVANLYGNYTYRLFNDHIFNFLAGYSHEEEDYKYFWAERRLGQISNQLPTLGLGDAKEQYNGETKTDVALNSAYSRFDYNYKGKYLLETTFRYDGSSRFATGHKWSPFWGISGAWNITNETFMEGLKGKIDQLKLRGSWGQMGNQVGIGLYDYISSVSIDGIYPMGNPSSPVQQQIARLGDMASTSRTWETIKSTNIGLDFAFLRHRLSGSFDYYIKNNRNMFYNREYPQVLGTKAPSINGAKLRTNGWELSLGWKDKIGKFNYSVGANLYDSKNEIIELAENRIPSQGWNSFLPGFSYGTYFGYEYDGLMQTDAEVKDYTTKIKSGIPNVLRTGDARYKDLDNDGKLEPQAYKVGADGKPTADSGDLVPIGDNNQHYMFGINLGASWKNVDFGAFFQGVFKWQVSDDNYSIEHWALPPLPYFYQNTWMPDRTDAEYPRLTQNDGVKAYNHAFSTAPYKLINNRYVRLKNLQIGYTLPSSVCKKVKMEKVRIYFSGTDLFEFKRIPKMYDPEKPFKTRERATPMPRGYSFGVNLTL